MRGNASREGAVDVWVNAPLISYWIDIVPDTRAVFASGEQRRKIDVVITIPEDAQPGHYSGSMDLLLLTGSERSFSRINLGGRVDLDIRVVAEQTSGSTSEEYETVTAGNNDFYQTHKGLFIIKPEDRGELYYLDPYNPLLHYIPGVQAMRGLLEDKAIGISDITLSLAARAPDAPLAVKETGGYASDLSLESLGGRIFLQVESRGELWYVNPVNFKRYYLGDSSEAFEVANSLALGIANSDFARYFNGAKAEIQNNE